MRAFDAVAVELEPTARLSPVVDHGGYSLPDDERRRSISAPMTWQSVAGWS